MSLKTVIIAALCAAGTYLWLSLDQPVRPDRELYAISALVFIGVMLWNLVFGD